MSSQAKIAANRANGRKSRGPRTLAGKSNSSRNAFRHGLAARTRKDQEIFAEIEPVAKAICNGATDPLLIEQALIIAENAFVLGCVQAECIAAIERCRDPDVTALATGDLGFTQAKETIARAKLAYEMRVQMNARALVTEASASEASGIKSPDIARRRSRKGLPAQPRARVMRQRDEFEAMRFAMPDLARLERYRRRAWSRVRRAIRWFVEIEQHASGTRGPAGPRHRPLSECANSTKENSHV